MRLAGKRGDSNIDMVISLAIFLVFLAWFFVFLRPFAEPKESIASLSSIIDSNIKDSEWQVEETKIFIFSNNSGMEPQAAYFPFEWNESSFQFVPERQFALRQGMLFFYADASESPLLLAHSTENHSQLGGCEISASDKFFTAAGARADFSSSQLSNLSYYGKILITGISALLNNESQQPDNSSFSNMNAAAFYEMSSGNTSSLYAAFCNSSRIFYRIDAGGRKEIEMDFSLGNFTSYYINNEENGDFSNIAANSSFIYLYDNSSSTGVSLLFGSEADILLNAEGHILSARINSETASAWISPHQGNYTQPEKYLQGTAYAFSIPRNESGLSTALFSPNSSVSLGSGFPATKKYFVNISCPGMNIIDGNESSSAETDVYAQSATAYLLYKNGTMERCNVQKAVW
jgi:hypothetical protein